MHEPTVERKKIYMFELNKTEERKEVATMSMKLDFVTDTN